MSPPQSSRQWSAAGRGARRCCAKEFAGLSRGCQSVVIAGHQNCSWEHRVHMLGDATQHGIAALERARTHAGRAGQRSGRQSVRASRGSFQDWIAQESSLGAAHR
eukprot:1610675-Pyramimonas_sp.AAC.1